MKDYPGLGLCSGTFQIIVACLNMAQRPRISATDTGSCWSLNVAIFSLCSLGFCIAGAADARQCMCGDVLFTYPLANRTRSVAATAAEGGTFEPARARKTGR